jgi:hypothetical protein
LDIHNIKIGSIDGSIDLIQSDIIILEKLLINILITCVEEIFYEEITISVNKVMLDSKTRHENKRFIDKN